MRFQNWPAAVAQSRDGNLVAVEGRCKEITALSKLLVLTCITIKVDAIVPGHVLR